MSKANRPTAAATLKALGWSYERVEGFDSMRAGKCRNGRIASGHFVSFEISNEHGERIGSAASLRLAIRRAVAVARAKALR